MKKFLFVVLSVAVLFPLYSADVQPSATELSFRNGILVFKTTVEKQYKWNQHPSELTTFNDEFEFELTGDLKALDRSRDHNRKIIVIPVLGHFTDSGMGGRWIINNVTGSLLYRPDQRKWFVEVKYQVQVHGNTAVIEKIYFHGISI